MSDTVSDAPLELMTAELEHCLLGSLMLDNRLYDLVADAIAEEHFSFPVNGRIFSAIGSLVKAGRPANPVTLRPMIEQDEALQAAGGIRYLVEVATAPPTLLNTPHYAEQIVDAFNRRAFAGILRASLEDAVQPQVNRGFDVVLYEHERLLAELADKAHEERPVVTMDEAVELALRRIEAVYQADGKLIGIPTGFADLDQALGGLHNGDLIIVAGRPGMGKTAFATGIAENASRAGKRVYFATLEMSAEQLAARQLGSNSGISAERQRSGPINADEMNALIESANRIRTLPILFDDQFFNSLTSLSSRVRRHQRRRGVDLLIVDYIQLLLSERPGENRVQEISAITRALKMLAKNHGIPVVALSQLSRAVEQRDDKRPQLADLRDSGSIEQDADIVMFLYRDEYYAANEEPQRRERESDGNFNDRHEAWEARCRKSKNVADVLIRKNRHGSNRTVPLYFDTNHGSFGNLARDRDGAVHQAPGSLSGMGEP